MPRDMPNGDGDAVRFVLVLALSKVGTRNSARLTDARPLSLHRELLHHVKLFALPPITTRRHLRAPANIVTRLYRPSLPTSPSDSPMHALHPPF